MWIDVTHKISADLPTWPGAREFECSSKVSGNNVSSCISLNVHTGTHVDAPLHFIPGAKTVEDFDINDFFGIVQIIDIGEDDYVGVNHTHVLDSKMVFFKTKNRFNSVFNPDYCYISPDAAQNLVDHHIKVVGIDYLSVENFYDSNFTTHKILLGSNIIIVESLNLQNISSGKYDTMIIPMRLSLEASPARVLIRPRSERQLFLNPPEYPR